MTRVCLLAACLSLLSFNVLALAVPDIELFFEASSPDQDSSEAALKQIASNWHNDYAALILDLVRVVQIRPNAKPILTRLLRFLEAQTGQRFGGDLNRWRKWMWSFSYRPHPDYSRFKGILYAAIDPRMRGFFPPDAESLIRLDEVDWGGVQVNGIPPLNYPNRLSVSQAGYLKGSHVVFGISVQGEARAYPKRILAWHEMARDRVGGVELTIVYCTLCGTVIPYESSTGGKLRRFGTSGLLYRSNKLMFDEETMSLWSSLEGKPVVGNLVGSSLKLRRLPVVTTTWGEWKSEHPDTTVLSVDTGHERDYSEDAAYRRYFSTDQLMFPVSETDKRLKNKEEVLAMVLESDSVRHHPVPLAVAARFLEKHRLYQTEIAGQQIAIVTSRKGANRVYFSQGQRFKRLIGAGRLEDADGRIWRVTEDALVLQADSNVLLPRLPAHRAFWFGWYAQYPNTKLIK